MKKKGCATRAEGQGQERGQGHTGVSVGAVGACAAHVDNSRVRRSVLPQSVASFFEGPNIPQLAAVANTNAMN